MEKITEISMSNENFKNLQMILEYLINSERKSYEEYICNEFEYLLANKSDNFLLSEEIYNRNEIKHIYAITRRVKDAIEGNS